MDAAGWCNGAAEPNAVEPFPVMLCALCCTKITSVLEFGALTHTVTKGLCNIRHRPAPSRALHLHCCLLTLSNKAMATPSHTPSLSPVHLPWQCCNALMMLERALLGARSTATTQHSIHNMQQTYDKVHAMPLIPWRMDRVHADPDKTGNKLGGICMPRIPGRSCTHSHHAV
jgi:hypothetical protein